MGEAPLTAQSVSSVSFAHAVKEAAPGPRRFVRLIIGPWIEWLVVTFALLVCFATPLLLMRVGTQWPDSAQSLIALVIAVGCAVAVGALAPRLAGACVELADFAARRGLVVIVAAGFALRLLWVSAFPAEPFSDGATYLALAARLAAGEPYVTAGTLAYWPIGYPLFLAPWVALFGAGKAAVLASNFALYLASVLGIARLATLVAGAGAGTLAALIFAAWPNYVTNTATPEKEMLVVALLAWALCFLVAVLKAGATFRRAGVAGALLGAATLVQPSLQLLPFGAAIVLAALVTDRRRGLAVAVLLVLAAASVIMPWTLRNYAVFGRIVLISTNGGDNLYRANNPLATGGYTKRGAEDLSHLGEVEQDHRGRALAFDWITNHPRDFARLSVEKLLRFAGDDAVGVYSTLNTRKSGADAARYAAFKIAANGFWMMLWMAAAALCLHARARGIEIPPLARLPIWLWVYLAALHSVFESAGKYHVPVAWVLCVLIATHAVLSTTSREAHR